MEEEEEVARRENKSKTGDMCRGNKRMWPEYEMKVHGKGGAGADRKMERYSGRDGEEGEEKKSNKWMMSSAAV